MATKMTRKEFFAKFLLNVLSSTIAMLMVVFVFLMKDISVFKKVAAFFVLIAGLFLFSLFIFEKFLKK